MNKGFSVIKSDATYLMWVDLHQNGDDFAKELRDKTGLYINGGSEYGKCGENFVRINLACPKKILEDAMNRLEKFTENKNL